MLIVPGFDSAATIDAMLFDLAHDLGVPLIFSSLAACARACDAFPLSPTRRCKCHHQLSRRYGEVAAPGGVVNV
jgi:hypothetical protein